MESSHALKTNAAAYLLFVAILAGTAGWVMRGYADEMVIAQSISCGSPATLMVTIPGGFGNAYVGVSYSNRLQVVGGTNCVLPSTPTWTFTGLPAGLTGSSTTGSVTGTPTTAGISPATVVVSDCGIGAQKQTTPSIPIPYTTFALKSASAISITTGVTTVAIPNTSAGQIAQVTFSDGTMFSNPAIPIVWQLAGTAGTINSSTGAITAQQPGGNVSVTANFGGQSSPPESVSITGGTPPSTPTIISTSPLPSGFATIAYPTVTLAATGGTGGCCTWAPTGAIGASGLSMSSAGVITGSSPTAGTYGISAVATDGSSNASPAVGFSITINSVNSPVQLSLTNGGGTAVSLSNSGTAQTTVKCSWSGGSSFSQCPTNTTFSSSNVSVATVNSTGLITAAASGTGTANITAGVPGCGTCTSNIVAITVTSNTVTFSTSTLTAGQQGISYPGTGNKLACSGGTPPYTFAVNTGTLPVGLTLSSAGALTGTVNLTATTQNMTFKCTDSASNVGTSGTIPVTIAVLSTVSITPLTPSIPQGGTQQFMLTGNYTAPIGTANVTNLVTGGSGGSLAVSQICNTGAAGVNGPNTFSCTIPAGHLVAVWLRANLASDTFTVTDSASQTYTQPSCSPTNTNSNSIGLFYKANTAAITTLTVNDTMAGSLVAEVYDISGAATTTPLDACPTGTTTAGDIGLTSPSLTTTNANDILLYGTAQFTQTSVTPSSPFTIPTNANVIGRLAVANEIVSAAQTGLTTANSWPSSTAANGIIAAFKAAASSTGWSSSNNSDVTVNGTGLATAQNVSTGTTVMGCVTMSICASTTVTVTGVADTGLVVLPNPASGTVGNQVAFSAKGNNSGNPYAITVSSSNQSIATTSGANATCIAAGSVTITASASGLSGTSPLACSNPVTSPGELLGGCSYVGSGGCALPAGWTLKIQQDFECTNSHATPANPSCGQLPANIAVPAGGSPAPGFTTSINHTSGGQYAYGGTFQSSNNPNISLYYNPNGGLMGTVHSVYGSIWIYTNANFMFGSSDFQPGISLVPAVQFTGLSTSACSIGANAQGAFINPADSSFTTTDMLVSVSGDPATPSCGNNGGVVTQGVGGGAVGAGFALTQGTWTQVEMLFTPNTTVTLPIPQSGGTQISCDSLSPSTPGCGNGELAMWVNGVKKFDETNLNVNGGTGPNATNFTSDPEVWVGSFLTAFDQSGNYCGTFTNGGSQPGSSCPPPGGYYFDDLIILAQ